MRNNKIIFKTLMLKGEAGATIASMERTGHVGTTDIYTITFSDGTTAQIPLENMSAIISVEKTSQTDTQDIYTITCADGSTQTFSVLNHNADFANMEDHLDDQIAEMESDIAEQTARIDYFLATQTGTINGTKRTETVLFESATPSRGTVIEVNKRYLEIEDEIDNYDYIEIYYGAFDKYNLIKINPSDVPEFIVPLAEDPVIWAEDSVPESGGSSNYRAEFEMYKYPSEAKLHFAFSRWRIYTDINYYANDEQSLAQSGIGILKIVGIKYTTAETSKDPELTDVRVGADGVTYASAGAAVRGQITAIKEDLNSKLDKYVIINPSVSGWQRKTGRSTDVNDPQDSTTRIMSVPYISTSTLTEKKVYVTPSTGYKWIIYQSDGSNYIGGFNSYTWSDSTGSVDVVDNAVSIILLIAKTDNSEILTSDYDKVEFYLKHEYAKQGEVDALTSDVNTLDTKVDDIFAEKDITFAEQSTGQIYYVNGNVGTSGDYKHTDYYPVEVGDVYRFTGVLSGVDNNASGVCGYDSSKAYVCGLVGKLYSTRTLYNDVEFTIPTGVAYIRLCSAVNGSTAHEIELKQIFPDSIEKKLNDAISDIDALDLSAFNGIDTAYTALKNFSESSSSTRWKNNLSYLPSFIHISDLHYDYARFGRAAKVAKYLGVDGFLVSGDMVNAPDNDFSPFTAVLNDLEPPYLPCIGNHDSANKTEQYIYEKFIEPLGEFVTFPTGISYPNYYYKDFSTKSIRLIVVDQYQGQSASGSKDKIHFTQDQITWLCNTLLATPENYGVIIMMHTPEATPVADATYNKFKQSTLAYWPTSPYTVLSEIVDTFISGTSLTKTYNNDTGSTPATFTVDVDFSSKNTGTEFIAFVCGHLHADNVSYVPNTTNKQLLLNITCGCAWSNLSATLQPSTTYPYYNELSDLSRATDGPNQDAINLYVIDRTSKSVRIVRIGANMIYDLSKMRDYMVIPYAET